MRLSPVLLLAALVIAACDDGTDELPSLPGATGIHIDRVELNQGVAIAVADGGAPIAPADRRASIVSGRGALVRVFWRLDDDFAPRELEARLTLAAPGRAPRTLVDRRPVGGPPDTASLDGTFHWLLDADDVVAGTEYAVELFEPVEAAPGTALSAPPRVPADGLADLGVIGDRMVLELVVVPLDTPCIPASVLSSERKAALESYLYNVFPVQALEVTYHAPLVLTECPDDIADPMEPLAALRRADGAAPSVYYQGLLGENDRLSSGGYGWLLDEADPDDDRVSVAVDWRGDGLVGDIMAHELGHNMGRHHPDGDPGYPYDRASGALGVWGFGLRAGPHPHHFSNYPPTEMHSLIDPDGETYDIMGPYYAKWVSDHTWQRAFERIRAISAWQRGALGSARLRRRAAVACPADARP